MARVILIHGAFNELWGPHEIKARWLPALRDGLWHHGVTVADDDVDICFYGDLFRRDPEHDDPTETARTRAGAAELISALPGGNLMTAMQDEANAALRDRTIDLIAILTSREGLSETVHARLESIVQPDTRVIVAHSLGTVVAYRALCRHPEWSLHTLVTLGSPLGAFANGKLIPVPDDPSEAWPAGLQRWVNVAALHDPVASVAQLAAQFGEQIEDHLVDNGFRAHDAEPYLNSRITGQAVAAALSA